MTYWQVCLELLASCSYLFGHVVKLSGLAQVARTQEQGFSETIKKRHLFLGETIFLEVKVSCETQDKLHSQIKAYLHEDT